MEILGKSNQTLLGHTQDCMTVCNEILRRNKPFLENLCKRYNWDWEEVRSCIRFAVWFHDIGKSSDKWQSYIRKREEERWKHQTTHALPSFAIAAMCLEVYEFEKSPRFAALFAILAHHLQMLHDNSFPFKKYRESKVNFPNDYVNEHLAFFREREPRFKISKWQESQLSLGDFCEELDDIKDAVRSENDLQFKVLYSLMLNILTASDTYASKNEPKEGSTSKPCGKNLTLGQFLLVNDEFPLYDNTLLKLLSFLPEGKKQNKMQQDIVASDSDRLILNAGCGEGKTAAALLFAQKLLKENRIERIILTLPTKFTANNLYRDLVSPDGYDIPEQLVGIIHGDSKEFLKDLTTSQETKGETEETKDETEEANPNIIAQEFENNFYAKPVTISTVDHLLMSFYHGYKYADRAFFNVASSLVVFDEAHYYEQRTTEAIAEAMRCLTHLKIPHLVMTATISPAVCKRFDQLNPRQPYPFQKAPADIPETSEPKIPFEIVKLNKTPLDEDDIISSELVDLIEQNRSKRQIIFFNQVNRAKNVYLELEKQEICENLICYHSGFISKDRVKKEKIIRSLFKKSSRRNDEEIEVLEKYGFNKNSDACILVSTQVSELSLDISADVMYSEIAPIDSIVQRGGRLNRKGVSPFDKQTGYRYRLYLMPAYEDEKACLPYEPDILQKSWDVIGNLYTFHNACKWVEAVYQESQPLMHKELSDAIYNDLIFGKRPQDNYYDGKTEKEGRVVIREQKYQTYDVVPIKFERKVIKDYRKFKTHHLSIASWAFWKNEDKIHSREGTLKITNPRTAKTTIDQRPFRIINADYCFDIGLPIGLEKPTNII